MKKIILMILILLTPFVYFAYKENFFVNKINNNSLATENSSQMEEVGDKESESTTNSINEAKNISETADKQTNIPDKFYIDNVPFTSQAPKADWKDERQQDGCEEASAVMVDAWLKSEKKLSKDEALKRIFVASDWFLVKTGTFHDAGVEDVVKLLNEHYQIKKVDIIDKPSVEQLKEIISQNKVILVPTNGRLLGNPNFSGQGPERHMILLKGYNDKTGEFITNDPGTRKGEDYRYPYETVINSNLAYPTGYHEKIDNIEKKMIVIGR